MYKEKNNKLKIFIPIIISISVIIAAFLLIKFEPSQKSEDISPLSTAQKYLTELNYEQALIEFKKAIELDPMNADAYLGLAQAYEKLGDIENAVATLEKGYELTGDERIKAALDVMIGVNEESEISVLSTPDTTTETTVKQLEDEYEIMMLSLMADPNAIINRELLDSVNTIQIWGEDFIMVNCSSSEKYAANYSINSGAETGYYTVIYDNGTKVDYPFGKLTDCDFLSRFKNLTYIDLFYNEISDLSGLSGLTNLSCVRMGDNKISDLTALSSLNSISWLGLNNNDIINISPLTSLTSLSWLGIDSNNISDIEPIADIKSLRTLYIAGNPIAAGDIDMIVNVLPECEVHS